VIKSGYRNKDMENTGIAILLMAGKGERLYNHLGMKKQFYPLKGQEMFLYPLKTFLSCPFIGKIVIVTDEEDIEKTKDIVRDKSKESKEIVYVTGGKDRNESVYKALLTLENDDGKKKVFIHDADRPLISLSMLEKINEKAAKFDALTPVLKINDSLLRKEGSRITYIDRKNVYQIQTPQVFTLEVILSVYLGGYDKNDTDDFKKAVIMGFSCDVIDGCENDFKVTEPQDIDKILKII